MHKIDRLEEDIKYYLSRIISEKLKNPNINGIITVTGVKVTKDQKYAKVYLSIFNVKDKTAVLEQIRRTKGYIKRELGLTLKARNIPELIFEEDDSMEYGSYMDEKIRSLNISHGEDKQDEEAVEE